MTLYCDNDTAYYSGTVQPCGGEAINQMMKLTDMHKTSLFEQAKKREVYRT